MRTFLMGVLGLLIGAVLFSGAEAGDVGSAMLTAALGVLAGVAMNQAKQHRDAAAAIAPLRDHVQQLQQQVDALRVAVSKLSVATEPQTRDDAATAAAAVAPTAILIAPAAPPPALDVPPLVAPPQEQPPLPVEVAAASAAETAAPETVPAAPAEMDAAPQPAAPPPYRPPPPPPDIFERGLAAFRQWLFGGNTFARVGILVLFLGLAFLLRLVAETVTVPVELRYVGVALVAVALQVVGWRLRERRRTYALVLQGGAVAVLYLTIFAAMRLHPLIAPSLGFMLLVAVVVFSTILAVVQDSLALAAAGTLGGFAAPLLASTGGEHHVVLFSYFALLNAGILAIAWFKAWRLLNLIGFAGTFVIGFAWGIRSYQPDMLATTEPFLVLFFAMYVAIALLFARRVLGDAVSEPPAQDRDAMLKWAALQTNYLDGILLFGVPMAGFGLQYGLIRHIHFGAAYSALGLGLAYMLLALTLLRRTQGRYRAVVEVYIALGVIFGTLAIPLGLDARWTAAAWAVEGAGVYWIGLKQDRFLARLFALVVQAGAAITYLSALRLGNAHTLLSASRLGAAMLGGALLLSYWNLRGVPAARRRGYDRLLAMVLAGLGLAFLYLLAPLSFEGEGTAIGWAAAGLATLIAGLRLRDNVWIAAALVIQVMGGLAFIAQLPPPLGGIGGAVLASGWRGLLVAALIGAGALAGYIVAARDPRTKADPALVIGWSLLLLFGLVFINLSVLFVLPWGIAGGVWAASGLAILVLGLALQQRASFGLGLILQVAGGGVFLTVAYPALLDVPREALTPFWHSGFWTPIVVALVAYAGAWRLFRAGPDQAGTAPFIAELSTGLLVWATLWWGFAWVSEIERFLEPATSIHAALGVAAATTVLWMAAARHWHWPALARFCALSLPAGILALSFAFHPHYHPAGQWGWAAWLALVAAHLLVLRLIPDLLPAIWPNLLHVVGCWLFLLVLALEVRYGFIALSDRLNAWRWLGWASVPALYLLLMTSRRLAALWPFSAYEREYSGVAALPIAVILLAWFWASNVLSDGSAQPLPYLPLVNPLELGQLLVLFSLLFWLRSDLKLLPLPRALPPTFPWWLCGASALFLLTAAVLRTAHHWLGIPFTLPAEMASMAVQASLSLLWGGVALALMVVGHARRERSMWIVGTTLVAVVVIKLFLVELLNTAGLARIVSFIGVGLLLLIIGYFVPLPPRRAGEKIEEAKV
jgi:uncharacterized membrane protein